MLHKIFCCYNNYMNSEISKIKEKANDIIVDNNFLFDAFENRLLIRLVSIFESYHIPINKNIIKKNMEENLINNFKDLNEEIIDKYIELLVNYEKIIMKYVENKTKTDIIRNSTMNFVNKIKEKNSTFITMESANNFIEYVKSIIYVYDNHSLNEEVFSRINTDIKEILNEYNRNNYNFVIESINDIIKNIIRNL